MTARQTDATTDPQSMAALQQMLDAALAREAALAEELAAQTVELAERKSEFGERIAQQAATIDVLKVMSASPGDPQPVFYLIVRRATELCNGLGTALSEFDGGLVHFRASYFTEASDTAAHAAHAAYAATFPFAPTRGSISCRAILDREIVHIRDTDADLELSEVARELHKATLVRSQISIPLMRDGQAIGAISLAANDPGGFSDSQIELLKTFAEQAVIAITSAETYRALQTRTSELQESLEYQTATSDVLKAISRAAYDLQPVLDEVVETAARLCSAEMVAIARREGDLFPLAAHLGFPASVIADREMWGALDFGNTVSGRAAREGRIIHVHNVADEPNYPEKLVRIGKQRSSLGVPLLRDDEVIGVMVLARQRVEPFTDRQIGLIRTFADQAVIAIENTRLITEQREALEQQTATAEVLQVINANPGDLTPVFDAVLERALRLCGASFGALLTYDGEHVERVAFLGVPPAFIEYNQRNPLTKNAALIAQGIATGKPVQATDILTDARMANSPSVRDALVELGGVRALLQVPLLKDGAVVGFIGVWRREPGVFPDKQIALLEGFAAQAVIAMENARLITEQREALEQQTAMAEVLRIINESPGDLAPVFDAILDRAHRLCGVTHGALVLRDGDTFRAVATHSYSGTFGEQLRKGYRGADNLITRSLIAGARFVHLPDLAQIDDPMVRASFEVAGVRTGLFVPLRKDDALLGMISSTRREIRLFSDKEIALVENFAAQAVIAIENARLLDEIRRRQEELRVTFENMGDGVAMFDESQCLVAWNRKFQDILDVPDEAIAERLTFADYIRYLTERGEYGAGAEPEEQIRRLTGQAGEIRAYERTRPDGRVIEIRRNPVAGGGFVLIFSDISERKRNEAEVRAARDAAEEASRTIEAAFRDLKAAQANLIQAEKMASLGQLTAGIAHEIKNPLNFVNNFGSLSVELLDELKETVTPLVAGKHQRTNVEDICATLTTNLEKIVEHGKRADGIVKAMLEHSRGSSAERRMVDLNTLIEEALNLVYHGARAQDQSFNITLERDFAQGIAPIEVNPQDMTRVFLNIFSNGFYAATRRARDGADARFVPTLKVTTCDVGDAVEIRVRDNGTGIPADIKDKLFQPFFTTKPTGEGTGLGLSITYDIVTKQHGGTITLDSEVGEYSEFTIRLPRNP